MSDLTQIGFIGLGNMGGPMAKKIVQSKPLVVFDLDKNRMKSIIALDAAAADSAADIGRLSDLVLISLPDTRIVGEFLL